MNISRWGRQAPSSPDQQSADAYQDEAAADAADAGVVYPQYPGSPDRAALAATGMTGPAVSESSSEPRPWETGGAVWPSDISAVRPTAPYPAAPPVEENMPLPPEPGEMAWPMAALQRTAMDRRPAC